MWFFFSSDSNRIFFFHSRKNLSRNKIEKNVVSMSSITVKKIAVPRFIEISDITMHHDTVYCVLLKTRNSTFPLTTYRKGIV